ncbi:uncharacterized protein LOC111345856 isoform X3 [Stylophora pistillata]|uniref:uncharacterized protein LOC111345856 isoform X3 n=1 Tax=Stylophora pistillata TaxID=50429 RepID=UPI000C03E29B|nr:uncharacterized protein LOC111345856 isoform X3 [Stylophora pistillata]
MSYENVCAMRSLHICVFLACSMVIVFATSQDQYRQLKFRSEKAFDSKRFINHVVRITVVMVMEFCETMCYMEPNCVSINIDKRQDGNRKYKCELNNVTHEGHKDDLIENGNYSYHAAESACVKNSCKNNATCQSGFTDKGYRCLCTAGFKGQSCDEDIDECATSNHGCSTTAVCKNTKGSYNCTCKPGYSGDGRTCKDIDECAVGNHECDPNAVCNNTRGSHNCTCMIDYWGDGKTCIRKGDPLFSTCKEVYDRNIRSTVGKVVILNIDSKPISVFCHKKIDGCGDGGWTPVMKIDGDKDTFHYDSHYWTNKNEYNPLGGQTAFDRHQTKLLTYWNTPFSKICFGMRFDQQVKFIVIKKQADSLYSLIADGKYRNTSLGRKSWKGLCGSKGSLQPHCNREGFNAFSEERSHSRARIGILGNNENDCKTCDSRIGFGTGGYPDDSITCGNAASWWFGSDKGGSYIRTMGYILVQ